MTKYINYITNKKISPYVGDKEEFWSLLNNLILQKRNLISKRLHWHATVASGARTICLPQLVKGVSITDKILNDPQKRFEDTYRFVDTLISYPYSHPNVIAELDRTNALHRKYQVADNTSKFDQEFFRYILFNLFVIAFQQFPQTADDKFILFNFCVLVAERMNHIIEGTINEFEEFIIEYERRFFFHPNVESALRSKAIAISKQTEVLLQKRSIFSPYLVNFFTPSICKQILKYNLNPIKQVRSQLQHRRGQ